jgi:hypothetical protein
MVTETMIVVEMEPTLEVEIMEAQIEDEKIKET